jgi:hypothetical protein
MKPYQFAILRYQHSAAAGEQVNIGVALWSPAEVRLYFFVNERFGRLKKFFGDAFDGATYRQLVRDLEQRAAGVSEKLERLKEGDLFASSPSGLAELLVQIAPYNAACFQWSELMGGVAVEPAERFPVLLDEFIFRFESRPSRSRRTDSQIWLEMRGSLRHAGLIERIELDVPVSGKHDSYKFRAGWKNGVQHVIEGISFDHADDEMVLDKAHRWWGLLADLHDQSQFQLTGVVAPPTEPRTRPAYEKALRILRDAPSVREIVEENSFVEAVLPRIEADLLHDES